MEFIISILSNLDSLIIVAQSFFWFVVVFTIIVFVHEFGHYYIARINNVKVEVFSIGFGPEILSFRDKVDTKWKLSLFPLGGYVKFLGDMNPASLTKDESEIPKSIKDKSFHFKTIGQRSSIVLAGPLANLLFGFIVFVFLFMMQGQVHTPPIIGKIVTDGVAYNLGLKKGDVVSSINNIKIKRYEDVQIFLEENTRKKFTLVVDRNNKKMSFVVKPEERLIDTFIGSKAYIGDIGVFPLKKPIVGSVSSGSPAEKSGLMKGDEIIYVHKSEVYDFIDVVNIIKKRPLKETKILVNRNEKKISLFIIPERVLDKNQKEYGRIGVSLGQSRRTLPFFESISVSFLATVDVIKKTIVGLGGIIIGKRDHCEVGGPILIAKVSNDVAQTSIVSLIGLIALISINLGLINLLPLPLLDGGHLVMYIIEKIKGSPVSEKKLKVIQSFGIALIVGLMLFSILNDFVCRILN